MLHICVFTSILIKRLLWTKSKKKQTLMFVKKRWCFKRNAQRNVFNEIVEC